MRRWIFYSVLSGQGIILYGPKPDETTLLRAVRTHAKAFKNSGQPGNGDKYRLQEIPMAYAVKNSQDFTYRAATGARMEIDG